MQAADDELIVVVFVTGGADYEAFVAPYSSPESPSAQSDSMFVVAHDPSSKPLSSQRHRVNALSNDTAKALHQYPPSDFASMLRV